MNVVVAYHGHCFDGMASAALLARFLREEVGRDTRFDFRGLDHQPGGSFVPDEILSGDANAVVDFRYSTSPRLTWWFDHHETGVVGDAERAHLEADRSGRKFYAPRYSSCCLLIRDVLRDRFRFEAPELAELVEWADRIDAARFPDAAAATRLDAAALELMAVVEVHGDSAFLQDRIERLSLGAPLAELAAAPEVQGLLRALRRERDEAARWVEARARCEGGVVTVDLADVDAERYPKFLPYRLFPESRYCVAVSRGPARAKVSVGSNPWAPTPRAHDLAALCARHGGGGHPWVGAVSLGPDEVERARQVARDVAQTLREPPDAA